MVGRKDSFQDHVAYEDYGKVTITATFPAGTEASHYLKNWKDNENRFKDVIIKHNGINIFGGCDGNGNLLQISKKFGDGTVITGFSDEVIMGYLIAGSPYNPHQEAKFGDISTVPLALFK